jgi:OPT family small oligopeptide transporter
MAISAGDRFGSTYNVSRLLTSDYKLNETAYLEYSPVYLTASFSMTYMLAYALTTSLIVYTALVHGKRILRTMRRMQVEPDDVHLKLMMKYPEVADWWYLVALSVCVVLGIVTVEVFGTGLPVWGYLVSIALAFVYIIPTAIMFALTNLEPAINLIAELIPGYIFQGQPLAGMIFKTFAVQTLTEAMFFIRDMKLGHYMKIPPRSMFIAQMSACAIACFAQVGVKTWMFATIPDMCTQNQKDFLVCSYSRTSYSASIIWGLVGPERLFSKGGIYNPQLYMLLVGAVLPVPFWLWCRKYPRSIIRNINVPIIFCICMFTPPANGFNLASFLFVGFIFQYWVRRYHFAWWAKYNYVLSAALDVGTLLCSIFVFLALRLPNVQFKWWGNDVYKKSESRVNMNVCALVLIKQHSTGMAWPSVCLPQRLALDLTLVSEQHAPRDMVNLLTLRREGVT